MKTRNRRYLGSSGMDRDKSEELGKTSGDYPTYWQNLGRSVENEIPDRLAIPDTGKQDFRRHDSDENENLKKAIGWIGKTRKLHVHHAFFFQLHFFAVTTRFRTFYGERKQVTTKFFLSLNLIVVVRNSAPKEFACIWQRTRVEIIRIEIERTQIHFLSDVFVAVA